MSPRQSQGRASFFWQGLFILLPVAIMAGIALTALMRDRAAAEREARQRAEELLQQVANGFDRALDTQLSQLEAGAHAPAPGTNSWALLFSEEGKVVNPSEATREAQPPGWRLQLKPEQLQAWEALQQLDSPTTGAESLNAALKRFLGTDPPQAAQVNAEFLRLRLVLADEPASNAVAQWLEFAQSCAAEAGPAAERATNSEGTGLLSPVLSSQGAEGDAPAGPLSESGVPLSTLALAKALQRARETGPSQALSDALQRELVQAPGSFTPMLLELAEPLARARPEFQPVLQELGGRWQAIETDWEAADIIRATAHFPVLRPTNFWFELQGSRWLCLLGPGGSRMRTHPPDSIGAFADPLSSTRARLFPKPLVQQAFQTVVEDSRVSLPPYLHLSAELEGEALVPSLPPGRENPVGATTLAQTEGQLGQTLPSSLHLAAPGGAPPEADALPPGPHFLLRIELANRALLFTAQRRRTWMYGALVLAAALTAAVGFGAAYRSFHRQLRLNDMKSNFVSSVSHELRAPIASVRLMAESLERGKITEEPKQHEYFRFIGQECRRLSSLIENVLDFSRIEQGRKQYEFEPTDLVELTRHTVQLMDTYAAERGVKLALSLPHPQPLAAPKSDGGGLGAPKSDGGGPAPLPPAAQPSVDGKAIQQALINLIDNALKHSPKGETVTVGLTTSSNSQSPSSRKAPNITRHAARSTEHDACVTLWVEDPGPGIPESEHERIFERFYRLGSELRRDTQGVGIGLSIVKHVVEAHGGRVRVQSAPGQGSRFTIELPLH